MSITVSEFTGTLPTFTAGMSGAAAVENLEDLANRVETDLNTLAGRIADINEKSGVIRKYAPIGDGVVTGTIVYWDNTGKKFEPALAQVVDDNGDVREAPQARVEGIVLADNLQTTDGVMGTILLGGYWVSSAAMEFCLGAYEDTPGVYYLSSTSPGRAVPESMIGAGAASEYLKLPVLTNYGGGKFNLEMLAISRENHIRSPFVRTLVSDSSSIALSAASGNVRISQVFQASDPEPSATAVSGINGRALATTPIVNGITGTGGITARNVNGHVTLTADASIGTPLDAYSINHNGTIVSSDNEFMYYTFPAGRASAALMFSFPVTCMPDGGSLAAYPWAIVKGQGASFTVSANFVPFSGTTATASSLSSVPLSLTGASGVFTYGEATAGFTLAGNGMLSCVMQIGSAPSSNIQLLRVGIRLVLAE